MYGLEKEERKKFDFDLEKEIKENHERKNEILKKCKTMIEETKKELKHGEEKWLSTILNGYDALEKVINKIK